MADIVRTTQLATEVISASPSSVVYSTATAVEVIVSRFIASQTIALSATATAIIAGSILHNANISASATASAAIDGALVSSFSGWGIPIS